MQRRNCLGLAIALAASGSFAQTYPNKPVKLVVPLEQFGAQIKAEFEVCKRVVEQQKFSL